MTAKLEFASKAELRRVAHQAPERLIVEIDRLTIANAILLTALQAFADRAEDEFQVTFKYEIERARAAIANATGHIAKNA